MFNLGALRLKVFERGIRPTAHTTRYSVAANVDFNAALHRAYRRFAQKHPAWAHRGFDEHFLHGPASTILRRYVAHTDASQRTCCAGDLAACWERNFGALYPVRRRILLKAELAAAVGDLLPMLTDSRP